VYGGSIKPPQLELGMITVNDPKVFESGRAEAINLSSASPEEGPDRSARVSPGKHLKRSRC